MIEWVVVDVPTKFPQACITDGINQKGPMVDTHREMRDGQHVYLSDAAVKKAATMLGYIEGEEAEKRQRAIRDTRSLARDLEKTQTRLTEALSENGTLEQLVGGLREQLAVREGRIAQLEASIREKAEAELALIQGTA